MGILRPNATLSRMLLALPSRAGGGGGGEGRELSYKSEGVVVENFETLKGTRISLCGCGAD